MANKSKDIAKADIVNLGSTYAYYDFVYDGIPIRGVNLAHRSQYLNMDLKYINKYAKFLKRGVKVLIVLPDFVFAADAKEMSKKNNQFYFDFLPWELEWFSISRYIVAIMQLIFSYGKNCISN